MAECRLAAGADRRLDAHLDGVEARVSGLFATGAGASATAAFDVQFSARRVVEDLGFALEASLLVRHSTPAVADAFCAARLGADRGHAYGTLPLGVDTAAIVDRALAA
jgi:putative acyl-CoA dehydrogenase